MTTRGMSPTTLSLRYLRADGWLVDVCERWIPAGPVGQVRKDLFGMLDLVAIRGTQTVGIQTTSASNALARLKKMTDPDHEPAARALIYAGWTLVVHGWRKSTSDGRACNHGAAPCACRWTLHRNFVIDFRPREVSA